MAVDRRARGAAIEHAALRLLQQQGLNFLASNARFRGGELDLVMRDGACVVFVEVRYRRSDFFGGGAASVDAGKQRRLAHAAQLFLQQHRQWADAPCRFDVVEAQGDPARPELRWIRDAFRLGE